MREDAQIVLYSKSTQPILLPPWVTTHPSFFNFSNFSRVDGIGEVAPKGAHQITKILTCSQKISPASTTPIAPTKTYEDQFPYFFLQLGALWSICVRLMFFTPCGPHGISKSHPTPNKYLEGEATHIRFQKRVWCSKVKRLGLDMCLTSGA